MILSILLLLHLLGVVVWVGGMFFAYLALRPAAGETLDPPQRLPLWAATLRRFFGWVGLAIVLIAGSGIAIMVLLAGSGAIGVHVHAMFFIGVVMMVIFAHVYFAPFSKLKRAVAAQEWHAGGQELARIRVLVAINLGLGLLTIAIATIGKGAL